MLVNTTQVDALVVPLTIELVDASGKSVKAGISESMPTLIEKFKKETPKEFHAYIKNNQINQPNGLPGVTQGGSPASCAAINRHVSGADARNPDKYYLTPPCNYYSKFMHDHSLNGKAYGFAYDDFNQQDTLLVSRKSGQHDHRHLLGRPARGDQARGETRGQARGKARGQTRSEA